MLDNFSEESGPPVYYLLAKIVPQNAVGELFDAKLCNIGIAAPFLDEYAMLEELLSKTQMDRVCSPAALRQVRILTLRASTVHLSFFGFQYLQLTIDQSTGARIGALLAPVATSACGFARPHADAL